MYVVRYRSEHRGPAKFESYRSLPYQDPTPTLIVATLCAGLGRLTHGFPNWARLRKASGLAAAGLILVNDAAELQAGDGYSAAGERTGPSIMVSEEARASPWGGRTSLS